MCGALLLLFALKMGRCGADLTFLRPFFAFRSIDWKHNDGARIEMVYRGTRASGAQWTESRTPVTAVDAAAGTITMATTGFQAGLNKACKGSRHAGHPVPQDTPPPVLQYLTYICSTTAPNRRRPCARIPEPAGVDRGSAPPFGQLLVLLVSGWLGWVFSRSRFPAVALRRTADNQHLQVPEYVQNVFEMLGDAKDGRAGDFYLDLDPAGKGFVYFVTTAAGAAAPIKAVLPQLELLVSAHPGTTDLTWTDVTFAEATWLAPSGSDGFVEMQAGCTLRGPIPAGYNDFDIILDHFDCFELDLRGRTQV